MTAPPQQQLTSGDHQYFEWSTSKQQTNLVHPLMTHTNRKHYYQYYEEKHLLEDNQLKQNKTTTITPPSSLSPTSHIRKKQKLNGIESSSLNTNDEQNQSQQQQVKIFLLKRKKTSVKSLFLISLDMLSISS
jgi:hypothetical protein